MIDEKVLDVLFHFYRMIRTLLIIDAIAGIWIALQGLHAIVLSRRLRAVVRQLREVETQIGRMRP